MAVCIEAIKKQDLSDLQTPRFIFERLANIIYPVSLARAFLCAVVVRREDARWYFATLLVVLFFSSVFLSISTPGTKNVSIFVTWSYPHRFIFKYTQICHL